MDPYPSDFFSWENLYQKLLFLALLAALSHIFKATMVKVGMTMGIWETLPVPNFVKIA